MLNVLFLMTIAALPWPTALIGEYILSDAERGTATVVYGLTMTSIAVLFNVVWRYASSGLRLLPSDVNRKELGHINRSYLSGPIMYGAATLIAMLNAWISMAIFAVMALFWLIPGSGPRVQRLRSTQEDQSVAPPASFAE